MPRTLHAGVAIVLPDDEFDAADAMVKVKPLWREFSERLAATGVKFAEELKTSETKGGTKAPAKRGRKAASTQAEPTP